MAALKSEVKAFIIQSVACYDTPTLVVDAVLKEFGVKITRQQAEQNDPTKIRGGEVSGPGSHRKGCFEVSTWYPCTGYPLWYPPKRHYQSGYRKKIPVVPCEAIEP